MMQLAILTTTVLIIQNQLLQTTLPGDATSNRPLILPVFTLMPPRFTDGGEFGFGAEIGISTQKLHARGPMGLQQLTTIKYEITGNGQIRK